MAFRVVIAGGGTGGHVFPALALADGLMQRRPDSELLFVGSVGGLEQRLVPQRGYQLELLHSGKLRGMGPLSRLTALASLLPATARAVRLLRRFSPDVVVGLGGYASAPVVVAAGLLRLPVVLLEQNATPGTVNRGLARLARVVVVAHGEAARHLPAGKARLLGNPIRPELVRALEQPGEPGPPTLLVLGGSQGAHAVNELMVGVAARLVESIPDLRIHHQCGAADHRWVEEAYAKIGPRARVDPFVEEMGPALRCATLMLGRSGATTLAELCVAGLPALLIPYPHATDDHQAANAAELVQAGGALMRRQESLTEQTLACLLVGLLQDPERLERMGRAMKSCGRPHAADEIARMLLEQFAPGPPRHGRS